jgi:hypothetical protein
MVEGSRANGKGLDRWRDHALAQNPASPPRFKNHELWGSLSRGDTRVGQPLWTSIRRSTGQCEEEEQLGVTRQIVHRDKNPPCLCKKYRDKDGAPADE